MTMPSLLYPARLREGATLGLVAPASPPLEEKNGAEAIERLQALGFRIKPGKYVDQRDGYLAGSDAERAGDVNAMFSDPEVEGIIALRGGYGSCRILPLLDYAAIRAHPKLFLGYSDITAMHQAILKESGLVTFHGPNAMEAFLPSNIAYLRNVLMESTAPQAAELFSARSCASLKTIIPGRAQGRLIGGNMTCLVRLLGTPYAPDFNGAILFLEDIGEKAYRIDGLFTQLRLAGVLSQISGLIIGVFDHTDEMERWRISGCLEREARQIGVPTVTDAPIGHFPEQIVVPHGVEAILDADDKTLRCL
jgi:muramoyltetrapeptide carboxypeptidase